MDTCVPELLASTLLACHACAMTDPVAAPLLVMTTAATHWLLPRSIAQVVVAAQLRMVPEAAAPPLGRGHVRGEAIDGAKPPAAFDAPKMWTLWGQDDGGLSLQIGGRGLRGIWRVPAQDRR